MPSKRKLPFTQKVDQFRSRWLPGLRSGRNVYWFYKEADGVNFGDWIGPYLFEKITNRKPLLANPAGSSRETTFFVCGSILHLIKKEDAAIVWGAGAIKDDISFPGPRRIHAVRGPLSRDICLRQGYDCPEVYGDPGLLLPQFFRPKASGLPCEVGLIPHFKDLDFLSDLYSGAAGVRVIDVRRPVEDVVRDIAACKTTISTSLHGLIISHAYGIPSAWGIASDLIIGGEFKYRDYFLGAQFDTIPKPIDMTSAWTKESLIEAAMMSPKLPDRWSRKKLLDACPFGNCAGKT